MRASKKISQSLEKGQSGRVRDTYHVQESHEDSERATNHDAEGQTFSHS